MEFKDKPSSYIIVFLLIYITSSYFFTVTNIVPGIATIVFLFFASILSIVLNERDFKKNFSIKSFLLLLFMLIVALMSALFNGDGIYNHTILIFAVISGYLITIAYSFDRFINIYLKVMYFISAFSIFVFLVVLIFPSVITYAPVIGQRDGVNVHNLVFSVALPGSEFNRNYGFFWEPGAFQVYLNLALIFELFITKRLRKKYVLAFILAVITTFSTTGYIVLLPILVAYMLNNKGLVLRYKNTFKYIIAIIVVALIAFRFMPDDYIRLLFGKLEGLFSESGSSHFSTTVRVNAIIYPFFEFLKSPIVGVGYEKYLLVAKEKIYSMPTFTPINWFALFGILWGFPCNYYYLKNILRFRCGLISKISLLIALVLVIMSEDFIRIAFIYVFIFYGAGKINKNNSYSEPNIEK